MLQQHLQESKKNTISFKTSLSEINEYHICLELDRNMSLESYQISQESYDAFIKSVEGSNLVCPECEMTGNMTKSKKSYTRNVINSTADLDQPPSIKLVVYYCENCKSYHALLPCGVVPFSSFTYAFIFEALHAFYLINDESKRKTAMQMGISRSTLRCWIRRFEEEAGSVTAIKQMKQLLSALFTDENALSGKDLNKLRKELAEHLARSRALLFALLISKMKTDSRPFMIITAHADAKSNVKGRLFVFGVLLCFIKK